jgi:hypothetical protein
MVFFVRPTWSTPHGPIPRSAYRVMTTPSAKKKRPTKRPGSLRRNSALFSEVMLFVFRA